MNPGQYQCAKCKGTFAKTRPDDEALAEAVSKFGEGLIDGKLEVVCDDCFLELLAYEAGGASNPEAN